MSADDLMQTNPADALAALRADALAVFEQALGNCKIGEAFDRHLRFEGKLLRRFSSPLLPPVEHSLAAVRNVQIVALGKAAVPMLDALMDRLPPSLRVDGVCAAPEAPRRRHKHIEYFQGSHPLPNEHSLRAGAAALDLLRRAKPGTFVFFLVSGGGSSLMEIPLDRSIPLDDVRAFHETLVLSGADIAEINAVRKFFSAIKGGRLAQAAPDSEKLTLLLADVPLKDLGAIASSPSLPNGSTAEECAAVLGRWNLLARFPPTVRAFFEAALRAGPRPESRTEHTQYEVLLSNHDLVSAARDHARALGYKVVIDNSCDNWDSGEAARYLIDRFGELRAEHGRVCLLSGGEVAVAVPEEHRRGCGGRNQHFALQTGLLMEGLDGPILALSAGSDGMDGNSPAAGAIVDPSTVERARRFHFDPEDSLRRFNTCPLFTALGDAIVTGPTGNNLRDLRVFVAHGPR